MTTFATTDLLAYLKTKAAITSLVGSGANARIRPGRLMQSDALPAIRYSIPGGGSVEHLDGISGTATPTLQIDCYGSTWAQAYQLCEAVRLALQCFRGAMGSTFVNGVSLVNRFYLYEPDAGASDQGKHRFILTFNVAHSEATS